MRKAIENKLTFYRDKLKEKQHSKVKDKVETLIKLFGENKIASFKTVENILEDLTSRRKATVELGEKAYQKAYDKYKDSETVDVRKQMRQAAVKKALAVKQSAVRMWHLLRRGLGFKITVSGKAMKGNVLEVNLSSPYIGAVVSHDVDSIVARAFKLAVS